MRDMIIEFGFSRQIIKIKEKIKTIASLSLPRSAFKISCSKVDDLLTQAKGVQQEAANGEIFRSRTFTLTKYFGQLLT